MITQVRDSLQRDLEARHAKLEQDVANWREDLGVETMSGVTFVDVAELRRGVQEGLALAAAHGLDVGKLTAFYEATKRLIRNADFVIPGKPRLEHDDRPRAQVVKMFLFAAEYEAQINDARAKHIRYKLGLYKNVTLAYIRALNAVREPLGPCTPDGTTGMLTLGGARVPTVNCPDPVVRHLRAYLNAVRKLQGADADAIKAQAEDLIAEQQFVADVIAGVPVAGDVLDIYAIYAGEDLAGTPMSTGVRAFMAVMMAIPLINSATAQRVFNQISKRSARAAVAFEKLNAFFRAASYMMSDAWYTFRYGVSGARKAMGAGLSHVWNAGVRDIDQLKNKLANAYRHRVVGDQVSSKIRLYQNLQAAVQGKFDISQLPAEWRERGARLAERNLSESILRIQPGFEEVVRRSGIYRDHISAMQRAARESNTVVMARPVNPSATRRIGEGWATKVMDIKSKSASHGPIAGALPVDADLNKIGSRLEEMLKRNSGSAGEIAKLRKELADAQALAKKCVADPVNCAKSVVYKVDGDKPLMTGKVGNDRVWVIKDEAGRLIDYETKRPISGTVDGLKEVEVFADPKTGLPLTADYDVLAFGDAATMPELPRWTDDRGFISRAQERLVKMINDYIGHPGGNLVHHGAESNFFRSPGVDYPITIFEPSGRILHIPACDRACMRAWCSRNTALCPDPRRIAIDADRLLKDYFFHAKHQGYNVNANPRWNWGPFNALSGWGARVFGAVGSASGRSPGSVLPRPNRLAPR